MSIVKSLRESVGKEYTRPSLEKLEQYKTDLKESQEAIEYLVLERGFTDETINHFQLGYNKGNNSIAIPIFKNGELINIKYRFLKPDKIKYTSERGSENWIYNENGIQEGLKKGALLIVEGEFDLMSAYQRGIKNIVSPASGKDSYGVWLAQLDNIPKVYIAYDNDEGGKKTGYKLAERLGIDKCFEFKYPQGIKDANDFFKVHDLTEFKKLVGESKPYYTYQYKGIGDIIEGLRNKQEESVKLEFIPQVEIEKDWLIVVSGISNVGKTSYILNLAENLAQKNIPTLILPFERGIESVGRRFLQVKFDKTLDQLKELGSGEWDSLTDKCIDTPVYFSLPKRDDIIPTIVKARRLFNTKFVIVDHLDYLVRNVSGNKEAEIGNTLQELKRVAEESGIVIIIVTHTRKIDTAGALVRRKPSIEDLKGSSSLYQDPECVVMLDSQAEGQIDVSVVKNKGVMVSSTYDFNVSTGKIVDELDF